MNLDIEAEIISAIITTEQIFHNLAMTIQITTLEEVSMIIIIMEMKIDIKARDVIEKFAGTVAA